MFGAEQQQPSGRIIHFNKAHPLLTEIFRYAHKHDMESIELLYALADVVATMGAVMEVSDSEEEVRIPFSDRLDIFIARVRERYPEILSDMKATKN